MKYFFGYNRFDSVLLETGLPSFDTVLTIE